jgi:hypothetical protein
MTDLAGLAEQLRDLDPTRLAAAVSLLSADTLVAVAVGVDVGLGRHRMLAQFAEQVAVHALTDDWPGGRFHRQNPICYPTELQRRRWPPNGDRDEWIKWGPAGAPSVAPAGSEAS